MRQSNTFQKRRGTVLRACTLAISFCFFLSACGSIWGSSPQTSEVSKTSEVLATLTPFQPEGYTPPPTVTASPIPGQPTNTPITPYLWVSPAVPDALRQFALASGLPLAATPESATARLDVLDAQSSIPNPQASIWFYALVAPFPTVTDGVSLADIQNAWAGASAGLFSGSPLWMDETTLAAFTAVWGAPAAGSVNVTIADQLVDSAWAATPAWAIVPFEALEPRWKVLSVDGQSPIHNDFDAAAYPLKVTFALSSADFPLLPTNRDASKLTVVALTGTTALTRAVADRMLRYGALYPAEDIRDVLRSADILHISNEVSFYADCPTPDPWTNSLRFCSAPANIALLEDIGVDVIELTGNHIKDYGAQPFLDTLDLYDQHGWVYYGGGRDLESALQPVLLEHNGNKLAFVGCNVPNALGEWATEVDPGAAPCDYEQLGAEIGSLRSEGYLPIMTFQYSEYSQAYPTDYEQRDFRKMAEAGALVVSGSQAHQPASMEFYDGAFVHYGLGNLFFDQMFSLQNRQEFVDRHVFYAGKYISVELLSFMLEDYSRPRLMTEQERADFLQSIFSVSGW